MERKYPRILISTVGPWSEFGSDMWSLLLSNYDKEQVASLYLRSIKSKSPSCSKYFQIHEDLVLKSIFTPDIKTGNFYYYDRSIDNAVHDDTLSCLAERKRYSMNNTNGIWLKRIIREFVWLFGRWKTKEFKSFIDDFDPEILVFPIESYIHLNRINKYIICKKKPIVIGFFNDDNFTYKQSNNLGYLLHRFWLRFSVKWLVKRCDTIFAICPKMKRECDKEFSIDSIILSKPMICNTRELKQREVDFPIRIMYAGKLYINRDKTITEIAKAIAKINKEKNYFTLDVYSSTKLSNEIVSHIECSPEVRFRGEIPPSQVYSEISKSDVLLFVEDLSNKNLAARLSFSTKITDCLGSGRCTWAIGNDDLGPIEYFKQMDAGLVSTSIDSIYETLIKIKDDPSIITKYAKKGYICGKQYHNIDNLIDIFENSLGKYRK